MQFEGMFDTFTITSNNSWDGVGNGSGIPWGWFPFSVLIVR